ncbi:cytochrome d ubiquinol oxidase subunit II [Vineibacter terrae]|uniref:Cytochrome d ubiquinol oxidase subunit II n=1 Tax=Vineibacter terrae TaxID=2586908 RepID=A0A5C8PKH4_9HYPH|nr:cytochrome d ubiquinol oxidase subunit II [Vineibacter terrae]TXL74403.1 cytochrome d ubiquinol oxidase subunit II [Vineibacter terrae]
MTIDLAFVWAGIIAFAVLAYVILDGFDLGIGILFPAIKNPQDRDTAIDSIAPVWDGNETWLVLGGGGLFAVFPLAYAVVLPALYMPITLMLLALVFRGVAFEFRHRTVRGRRFWDGAFAGGSMVAALCQGIALGALVQGIHIEGRAYAGGWWDWLTPFSILTGLALVAGYALLGATWLISKTQDDLQARCFRWALPLGAAMLAFIVAVSLATPLLNPVYAERWFAWPAVLYAAPVPLLVAAVSLAFWRAIRRRAERLPFLLALALFLLSYIGLGISLYPHIVPPSLTIWDAAAPESSLKFLLAGGAVLLPIILAYTGYAYWVFRGKVTPGSGYHH